MPLRSACDCAQQAQGKRAGNGATDGMVPIDGGAVMLGSSFAEVDAGVAYANEAPLRPVHLAPFWLDRVEVTAGAFRAWCESEAADIQVCSRVRENGAPCVDAATMPNHPMNCIAWPEANAYCRGVGKRLPSEEEWELAARGPERRTYPWGETPPSERDVCTSHLGRLFFGPCASGQGADDVTPEGVRDLGGSMSEWTSSGSSSGNLDARTAGARVSRGGAWVIDTAYRASFRRTLVPTARNLIQGFRCARDR
jgi:sulfatase modifying factor 1